ncbi:MAG: hypothetical protein AAGG59_07950 [Bacteroidota bacterium]
MTSEISPGKGIFLPPISTGSTIQVPDSCLPFGRQYDVPAHRSATAHRCHLIPPLQPLQFLPAGRTALWQAGLFVGTGVCSLASFSVGLTANHLASGYESAHKGLTSSGIIWYLQYQMPMLGTHERYGRMALLSHLLRACKTYHLSAASKLLCFLNSYVVGAFDFLGAVQIWSFECTGR